MRVVVSATWCTAQLFGNCDMHVFDQAALPCRRPTSAAAATPITLRSTSNTCSREAALIYFPGALIDVRHYIPLSHAIQAHLEPSGVALHVAMVPCMQSPGLPSEQDQMQASLTALDAALGALRASCGFEGSPGQLIFGGHSSGAALASYAALFDPTSVAQDPLPTPRCRSVLAHGGCTPPAHRTFQSLQSAPTAQILGTRDGSVRLSSIVPMQDDLDASVPDPAVRARIAPVAILPGLSHASFANAQASLSGPHALTATVAAAAATATIAEASAHFITMTDADAPAAAVCAAASFFERSTQRAREDFFDVYRTALARDAAGDTCRDVQELLLGLKPFTGPPIAPRNPEDTGFSSERVTVLQPRTWNTEPPPEPDTPVLEHDRPFLYSKPQMFEEGGGGAIGDGVRAAPSGRVQPWPQSSLVLRDTRGLSLADAASSPIKLRCKLKSGHAVAAALESGVGISPGSPTYTDADESTPGGGSAPAVTPAPPPGTAAGGKLTLEVRQERARAAGQRLDPFTAARMNEHVVRSVLSRLPEEVRKLYERSPRRLAFAPDVDATIPPAWAASELSFVDLLEGFGGVGGWQPGEGEGRVVLQSTRITTLPGQTRFDGMFYCTVISEAQAFDHIMYESQAPAEAEVDAEVDAEGVLAPGPAAAVRD